MYKKIAKGNWGEEQAVNYLLKHGYRIIERNWKKRYGEIDIIAIEGDFLVFVEVKTREEAFEEKPEEAMTQWKIAKLIQTAEYYKNLHPELPDGLRIDFVGVTLNQGAVKDINLIKNISGW